MRNDKERALALRLQGKSYTEIHRLLGVPKSTLSGWFSELVLSQAAQERIAAKASKKSAAALLKRGQLQTHLAEQRARSTRSSARDQIRPLSKDGLFLVGIALYWAEGHKRPILKNGKVKTYHPVSLSNADPHLVKIFLRFLREICLVPDQKIIAQIRIYEHHNPDTLLKFWREATGLPAKNFQKFYYGVSKSSQNKRPFTILPYGTIQIRVNDTVLYHRIMGWIDALYKQA